MGHMKWIFTMVEDGSYEDFKREYIKCVLTRQDTFEWGNKTITKAYGKSVVMYLDNHAIKAYNEHIDSLSSEFTETGIETPYI